MAQAVYTQTIIALVWDFDRTLIPGYSQKPLFEEYGVDEATFWTEVGALRDLYRTRNIRVAEDTAYLLHMLTYVNAGIFSGLTNTKLLELGARIEVCPGMPEFFDQAEQIVTTEERYRSHGITLEHYIISTGIRHMIEGSAVGQRAKKIWANEFVDALPPPHYPVGTYSLPVVESEIAQIGYMLDNTSKTRAIFEINKGPEFDVNARVPEQDRRVPIQNMIYIADGPSDVPVFSVVGKSGGARLGVYQLGPNPNYEQVKLLQDTGRVNSIAEANYSENAPASLWLASSIKNIANRICETRDQYFQAVAPAPRHVTS